jgi:hypothetical protein
MNEIMDYPRIYDRASQALERQTLAMQQLLGVTADEAQRMLEMAMGWFEGRCQRNLLDEAT